MVFNRGWIWLARLLPALTLMIGDVSHADPWAGIGDRRLREDIELLQDAGVLKGSTTVWPMPWANLGPDVDLAGNTALSPMHRAALARVRSNYSALSSDDLALTATVRATTEPSFRRDFSDRAREEADATFAASKGYGALHLNFQVGYRDNPGGKDYNFDGTYAALKLGNWGLYGGLVDLWWGPSHESSLVLSSSARPIPKVGFTRLAAEPFESRWLRWLGPWRFDAFAGVQTGQRSDPFRNPLIIGMRGTIQPARGLEIGVSRLMQLCGRGRPCSIKTIGKSLFPIGQPDNTGTFNEPGNQALALDIRYARPVGGTQLALYMQGFAEDTLFEAASFQVGGSLTGPSRLGTWRLGLEGTDTYARTFSKPGSGGRQKRTTYLHFIYQDGFSHKGRPMGYSLDGDTQAVTATASLTDTRNRRWSMSLTKADINKFNEPNYRITRTREKLWLAEAGVDWPTAFGDVGAEVRYQTDSPDTPGRKDRQVNAGMRWTTRF